MGMYYDLKLSCVLTDLGLEVWNALTKTATWSELAQAMPEYAFLELTERYAVNCQSLTLTKEGFETLPDSLVSTPHRACMSRVLDGNQLTLDTSPMDSGIKDRGGDIRSVYQTFFAPLIAEPALLTIDHEVSGKWSVEIKPIKCQPDWDRKYGDPIPAT